MGCFGEFKRLKFLVPDIKIIIEVIQYDRIVRTSVHGPPALDLYGAPELIGRNLFVEIDINVAFNPFCRGIYMTGPCPVVHKFVNGILEGLENLLVGTLNLLGNHLHVTVQFRANR
jgi:hypothetical protein